MEESLKKIERRLLSRNADALEKLRLPGGYVDTDNHPYDRLRRSLKRIFPGYPDVFDYEGNKPEKER